jgi:3-oxoacyl-[acyl-carrier protein] reductase
VAVVTGAARGIGAATARTLAAAGARVALLDREPPAEAARAMSADQGELLALTADVTDAAAVARAVGEVAAAWGRIDILVNNAGILRDATLAQVEAGDWAATLDVNLRGALLCAQAVLPHMLAGGYGRLLSASSIVARQGNYGQSAYAASKAGIIGLTRVWARELGSRGITANAVAPGFIDTEMARAVPEKVMARIVPRIPAGRLGRPEEVANVYLFLASEAAAFVNGAVVGVDGGLLL